MSLAFHDRDPRDLDTTKLLFSLAERYSPCALPPGTRFEASFGHLEGYSATYYTYIWSLAISKNPASAFGCGRMEIGQARRYRDARP